MIKYLLAFLLLIIPAKADDPHSHGANVPDWYDPSCCSNNDCMPVEDKDIEFKLDELGNTVVIYKPTNNVFYKNQFKVSQDERYHVCINPYTKQSLCFYDRGGV